MTDERTYTISELRNALKGAELPCYVRQTVYSNLPAREEPVLVHAGQKVFDCAGCVVGVVAFSSTFTRRRESKEIVVWEPDLGRVDVYRYSRCEHAGIGVLFNRNGERITGVAE